MVEVISGGGEVTLPAGGTVGRGTFTQLGGELLYRFGASESFYLGGRYNSVSGKKVEDGPEFNISRFNVGGGWFMTDNVLSKIEYVSQDYSGDGFEADARYAGAEFSGIMFEAVISF